MARTRTRTPDAQLSLPHRDKNGQRRGGARKGAGRPQIKGRLASEPHKQRPRLSGREPVLITARVSKKTSTLRRRRIYTAVRRALTTVLARQSFRIVHFSIQRTHLHLIAEADSQPALSIGMQGFLISAARRINAAIAKATRARTRGTVFPDRYHERVLTKPKQCRNAIRYVLNNWRRHKEDREGLPSTWTVDPFSSAVNFGGWKELAGSDQLFGTPPGYERLPTSSPATWLLTTGWTRHGPIGAREVPGSSDRL
jgi:REP element-mobilizing transposase RayT